MDHDKFDFHQQLDEKISSWKDTPNFGKSKYDKQKYNRTLNLLRGTNPEVITDVLGIHSIPDDPKEAMNLIRGTDLKTLAGLEIFPLKGTDKLVGHHIIAANTLGQHLENKPRQVKIDIFQGLIDRAVKHGMDPRQILNIHTSTHKSTAHGGDFTGKKTGAAFPVDDTEDAISFFKRFDKSIEIQQRMADEALKAPINTDWQAAADGVSRSLGLPDLNFNNLKTKVPVRQAGTQLVKPIAKEVQSIVNNNRNNPKEISKQVELLTDNTEFKPKSLQAFAGAMGFNVNSVELKRLLSTGAKAGTALGVLGVFGDAVQAKEGVDDIRSNSNAKKTAGVLNTTAAALGLSTLVGVNPVTAIPAATLSGFAGAIKTRIKQDQIVKDNFKSADPKRITAVDPYENNTQIKKAPKKKDSWFGLPDLGLTEKLGLN